MHVRCLGLLLAAATVATAIASADSSRPFRVGPEKKLIEWGWDEPNTAFMRENAEAMDRVGFDGLIFHADAVVEGKPVNFAWNCWSAQQFTSDQFAQVVDDLRACKFRQMTDNFLRFNVCPGDVDWFDDRAFAVVLNNARVGAKVARAGGCKGFMFDIEMYGQPLFTYAQQKHKDTKSFADYEAIVTRRGREFMQAVNADYPDITMMMTFGYSITGVGADRTKAGYGLLKNFLDGMYEACSPQTKIVDGYEGAYAFRWHKQYVGAYQSVREKQPQFCTVPDRYRKHVEAAFGIWMDMHPARYGWNTRDFATNYFTPDEFAYTAFAGLNATDRYVWIYTERALWWTHTRVPTAYRRALRRARGPMVLNDAKVPGRLLAVDMAETRPPKAAEMEGYSDEATFGDLQDKWDLVADLPKTWQFRVDPKDEGVKARWFASDLDAQGWRDLEIGRFWDEQGVTHVGHAWYRLQWDSPAFSAPVGAKVVLWFGAADEVARVWVNGRAVGEHDEGADYGWDKRFAIDVTGKLLPGQTNTIVVRVSNSTMVGGLWKSIKLATSHP